MKQTSDLALWVQDIHALENQVVSVMDNEQKLLPFLSRSGLISVTIKHALQEGTSKILLIKHECNPTVLSLLLHRTDNGLANTKGNAIQ